MRTSIVGLALAFLAASATGVLAQETTGTNTGRVIDPQGLVVPGATITVIGPQGQNVVVSDGNGRFTAPSHPALIRCAPSSRGSDPTN